MDIKPTWNEIQNMEPRDLMTWLVETRVVREPSPYEAVATA